MNKPIHLTPRQRDILIAIVESYIATGEPVGSATLSGMLPQAAGMSSATIRNEMAELAEGGLLEQPHTSAGRIPSAMAFQLYVEQLSGGTRAATARLPGMSRLEMQSHIDLSLAGVAGPQALMERTSHLLAALSSGVGVAISSLGGPDLLEHVHFSRLAERRVLAVVVTRGGMVRDRVLSLQQELTSAELEVAANFLNENFRGWNVENVRSELARRIDHERSEYHRLMQDVQQLWAGALPGLEQPEPLVYIEGVANLVNMREDRERLRAMLMALEAKQRLVELLNAYIDSRQESVRVVFGLEEQAPEMAGLVLIAAPARMGGETLGTVGVIGSQRLHYENAMHAVGYISQALDRISGPRSAS